MKLVGLMTTAILSLTLVAAAPAFAQEEQRDQQEEQKAKAAQDDKQMQPETKPEENPAAQTDRNTKPEENAKQDDIKKQDDKSAKPEEKNAEQQRQTAGNRGGQIPADKFKANFGQQHTFRVSQADYSNRRFEYGGYSFGFVEAWPSNWLYAQSVYVVEINGVYYLCNESFPGVNIALSFTP